MFIIQQKDFDSLISALKTRSYLVIGPTVRDNAVVYDEINGASDLPIGWTDEQDNSQYRLKRTANGSFFGTTVGPYSWKRFLFPPRLKILSVIKRGKSLEIESDESGGRRRQYAFIGVRPCELSAVALQDKVFMGAQFADRAYTVRRKGAFVVAVNCTRCGGTCFCDSMGTGPAAKGGYDIVLTEIVESDRHYFVAEVGSAKGTDVMNDVPRSKASAADIQLARKLVETARENMKKTLIVEGLKELLSDNTESPHWDEVARRCLMCANCTLVCPTCFCSTVEDTTDLSGERAERWRRWDSCFTMDFAKVTGGNFRPSAKARYRQWITHKLSWWIDQFGTSGCVGCGRCITWCPVGIDITAEVQALRNNGVDAEA